ncbi:hypothetical protein EI291_15200 [Hymenobacter rigui]|uniref:Uncharacterized protein n=2 Tax=Hymenobacter rigui TaxID=334424 RepID=A0A428KMD3_9BACT|nr:hypothetical protein EI291_15200 [Hymenobacter rigui]
MQLLAGKHGMPNKSIYANETPAHLVFFTNQPAAQQARRPQQACCDMPESAYPTAILTNL